MIPDESTRLGKAFKSWKKDAIKIIEAMMESYLVEDTPAVKSNLERLFQRTWQLLENQAEMINDISTQVEMMEKMMVQLQESLGMS